MNDFEEYIKARYPVDYESLQEKYPNFPVSEFYGDEQDLWDLKQTEIDQLKIMNQRYIGKMQEQQDQIAEFKARNEIKNQKIMKLVSIFNSLSSQTLCEEPELSDDFYKKFDEFHSVLINIEL